MEFGAKNLAMTHHLSALNALESLTDINETGRNRFISCRDVRDEELVCPKPRRAVVGMYSAPTEASAKSIRRLRGTNFMPDEGEAGHEILDILFSKVNSGDTGNSGSPIGYFSGSPPCRAGNPMIHDVHFTQKRVLSSPVVVPQKSSCSSSLGGSSSCSSSYGSRPFVRIEGFASSTSDSHRGVQAYA